MKKRLLSILLTLCMVMCLVPTTAFAEGETVKDVSTEQESTEVLRGEQPGGHMHYLCGGDFCTGVGDHTCEGKTAFTAWTSNTSLPETGVYYLTQDVTLEAGFGVTGELTLDLNGHSILLDGVQRSTVIYVMRNGSFTLTDCNGSGGKRYFVKSTDRNCAWKLSMQDETNSFAVDGGVITHGSTSTGVGVSVISGGKFTMYGGTVCGNNLDGYRGAGVGVENGAFTMYGGAVKGNATTNGGGVFVNGDCAFTMHGGEISENKAHESGGGLHVGCRSNYATAATVFTMTGGKISENKAFESGGGVYVGASTSTPYLPCPAARSPETWPPKARRPTAAVYTWAARARSGSPAL